MNDFDEQAAEYEEWFFPSLIDDSSADDIKITLDDDATLEPNNQQSLLVAPDEATELRYQLELKEAQIDEKINYLDSMGLKLSEQFAEAEAVLLTNTAKLIKKTVHKIILKEIALDGDILNKMINQAMENVNSKEHPCVIYVSKSDMKQTENNIFLSHVQFKINELLNQGDFVIENKFFSLEAILEDRINRLFNLVDS